MLISSAGTCVAISGTLSPMAEPEGVSDGLLGLPGLVADSVPLEHTLLRLAEYAAAITPNVSGAALTELGDGAAPVTVATSSVARAANAAESELGEGPGRTALQKRRLVVSGSLGTDPAWPRYAGRARRLGLRSVLACPLLLHDAVVGLLCMYASRKDAFTESDISTAKRYFAPSAVVIRNAQVLTRSQSEIQQLREALQVRPVIDQAIGIVRSRTGVSAEEAFERLRAISNVEHVKVAELAGRIVDDAVRRAKFGGRVG